MKIRNPKSEIRKKIKTVWNLVFGISNLFRISCLGFIISCNVWANEKAQIDITVQDQEEVQLDTAAQAQVIVPKKVPGLAQTLPQLLERAAGVQIKRYGGLDDFAAISIRGSTTDQVLIYLDGVLLNTAQGGLTDLSFLPLDHIERIEIYRGGSPGKIVDSTPGGVITIHTKGKPAETKNTIRNSLGSFYTYQGHIQRAQAFGDFYYNASFHHFRSRGDFPFLDDRGTRANRSDDRIINRGNNDFGSYDVTATFGEEKKEALNWKVYENFFIKEEGIPGLGSSTSNRARLGTLRNFIHAKLNRKNWQAHLFFDYLKSEFEDPLGEIGVGTQDNKDETFRLGPEFHLSHPLQNHIFSGFLAHRGEFFWPFDRLVTPQQGPLSQRHMVSVGLEDEISFLDDKVILDPSLRFQIFLNHLSGQSFNDVTDRQISAKLGIKISPWRFLSLKTNVYRGFRQPTFGELFGDRGTLVGNPNLKPEEAINFDLGIHGRWQNFWVIDDLNLEMIYFRHEIDNLIQFLQTSQFTAKAQNLNSALILGGEFGLSIRIFKNLKMSSHYVYQTAKDASDTSPTKGNFLPGRPKHQWTVEGEYQYRFLRPFFQLQILSHNFLDSQNLLKVTQRTLLSAGTHLEPLKWMRISFTTKNLLNDRIADIAGFPLPGRSYWGELELKL
ncbi:MAG: hypothetical protein A3F82_10540 [Deltaproteobacteria bacterium RIFCSPLOWO2_12_FULL_44_12]|nr:MAG: hypothetical protein A2712_07530 [Deltaproteobacteria bacterium RIFCSPHIGHO2_01_FULL_43_49]OGQ14806.1 MAG: hypothetical protein A3D22_09465 [Deltaproteobacteria bacterium RIFCSPHIGHO2_02_FULL_44_53]OGQ28192.1 MAG: hypothetical protein A3D98_08175 [Deltaproteobacteria bacterium RIFCSPHIGHO2_12_FULL_44_21]OGQ31404.1 MAG: hypothetical protein A2979_08225 [Deltaproteobacteria bacterium RIFCSPLOWO2_01_FULL_45_74]OGQ43396.1 MAG: hypothetical protein A3I70_01885 [Deltaproteobacteria bacterium 